MIYNKILEPVHTHGRFFGFLLRQRANFYNVPLTFSIQPRSRMIHRNYLATFLTILLIGTIPTTLLSYNNPGLEITIFSTYSIAYAAATDKPQTDNGDDQSGSSESSSDTIPSVTSVEKLQQKVRELMLEASNAKIRAAKATNAAGNATEDAESLSSIAVEADKDARRLLKSVEDVEKQEQNNNETTNAQEQNNANNYDDGELSAALSEAKEKRKAANLAEKDARELSDKADSLNEAAKRAERLASAAQKELEHAISDYSGSIEKASTNAADANAKANSDLKKDGNMIDSVDSNDGQTDKRSTKVQNDISSILVDQGGSTVGVPIKENASNELDVGEVNKQIGNIAVSDNEVSNDLLEIDPFSNTTNDNNDNNTPTSISSSANNTVEFEGNVDCKVILDSEITTSTASPGDSAVSTSRNIQNDGKDGGCNPQISASGRYQYNVWSEGDEDNRYILFKRSVNNRAFENPITLSGDIPSAVFNPKVTTEGDNVYVVWQGDSESGNQDILMRKSENNGQSFGDVINLSNDRAGSGNPEINVNSSNVYVVWDGTTPGNNDIYLRKSMNNGTDFDKVKNLSTNEGVSYEPKVVLDKKGLEIYWRDYRNGHEEILAKKSLNEGRTFEIMKNLDKEVLDLWKDRSISAGRS
jgi:hypothetical protein